jgi:hypothetical protein
MQSTKTRAIYALPWERQISSFFRRNQEEIKREKTRAQKRQGKKKNLLAIIPTLKQVSVLDWGNHLLCQRRCNA